MADVQCLPCPRPCKRVLDQQYCNPRSSGQCVHNSWHGAVVTLGPIPYRRSATMCHTLLQHYIPCRHTTVHFISCSPSDYLAGSRLHPNYASRNVEIHAYPLSAEVSDTATRSLPLTPEAAAQWRDHSVPQGVAHSYHRLCPTCLAEKIAEDEDRQKDERLKLRGSNWRRWADEQAQVQAEQEAIMEDSRRLQYLFYGNTGGNEEVEVERRG